FREQGRTQEAYAELLRMLPELDGTRRHEALASLAELAAEGGDAVRALSHYAELLDAGALSGVWLANAERLAMGASDWPYLVRVLERKLEVSEEPSLGLIVLDRLA